MVIRWRYSCRAKYLLIFVAFIFCVALILSSVNKPHEESSAILQRYALNTGPALEREVRLFCWVMTTPSNHISKAKAVLKTWGKRCTKLLFVTAQKDSEFETLQLPVEEEYTKLWGKTRGAFQHIYEHHKDEADWFLKADDDTYVFVENLRYLLYPYSPEMPIYFGHNMFLHHQPNVSYMSGGGGYVLSREALRRLVTIAFEDPTKCAPMNGTNAEDVEIGACLQAVNILSGDSRDVTLRNRFVIFQPYAFIITTVFSLTHWYLNHSYYNVHACRDCLSEFAVSFHYIMPEKMQQFEFFKYELKVFGLDEDNGRLALPKKCHLDEVIIPLSDNERAMF